MRTYQIISGQTIDMAMVPASQIEFLESLQTMSVHPGTKYSAIVALAYGPQNPILDSNVIPGRGAVTVEVITKPAYRVMTDILFRREMIDRGVTVEALADCHTMTPAEAAGQLGVSVSAIRQAIEAGRLGAWLKAGRVYIDRALWRRSNFRPADPGPAIENSHDL